MGSEPQISACHVKPTRLGHSQTPDRDAVPSRVSGEVELQTERAAQIAELEEELARVDHLHVILPICSYCKEVGSDTDSWQQMEA